MKWFVAPFYYLDEAVQRFRGLFIPDYDGQTLGFWLFNNLFLLIFVPTFLIGLGLGMWLL